MLSAVLVLATAELRANRGRLIAGAVALSIAASLVLAGFAAVRSVRERAPIAARQVFADDEIHIAVTEHLGSGLPAATLAEFRSDARVAELDRVISVPAVPMPATAEGAFDRERFYATEGTGWGGWVDGRHLAIGAWSGASWHAELAEGRWPEADGDVIELAVPARGLPFAAGLDDWLRLESDTGVHLARVVGVIALGPDFMPTDYTRRLPQVLTTPDAVNTLAGRSPPIVAARVRLHDAGARTAVLADWQQRLTGLEGRPALWDQDTIADAALHGWHMRTARSAMRIALILAGTTLIVLALAVQGMAVRDRVAQFTLLRALGAGRGTLFLAVLVSALPLALAALVGAVLLVWGAQSLLSQVLGLMATPRPDLVSIGATGIVVLVGVLLGSAWPAWRVARVSALPERGQEDPACSARNGLMVAVMVLVLAALVLVAPMPDPVRVQALCWVVLPGLLIGLLLATPWTVRLVARWGAGPVARLTGSDPVLLADQVAGDGPRSTGAVAAVGIGLSAFVALMIWGAGMLALFVIDPGIPRWSISFHPFGLDRAESDRLLAEAPLRDIHPLTVVDTVLGGDSGTSEATAVIGIDPQRSLVGGHPLPIRYQAGNAEAAAADLMSGDACLVNAWFAVSQGFGLGDRVSLLVPGGGERRYRIAGIVELRGWRMITKQNKMRRLGEKHDVLILLDADTVRRDFPVAHVNAFIAGEPASVGADAHYRADLPDVEAQGRAAVQREALIAALGRLLDLERPVEHRPDGGEAVIAAQRVIQVSDLDETRFWLLGSWGADAVKRMGIAPLFILALALLPVIGTLVAALRARARELGVLRSCGLTRSGLLRLSVGEGLLLACSSLIVGGLAGVFSAIVLMQLTTLLGYAYFIGLTPDFIIPWTWLWPGVAMTIAVCAVAALWAGWRIGRIAPAQLSTEAM